MEELIEKFLDSKNVFAVIGVSRDPEKYGYKVYKDLKKAGYTVYPINPKTESIDGDKCYNSLRELPERPDVVDIVVPPKITERIIKECKELGIKRVWMQPGSESEEAISFCKENDIEVVHSVCVMVERKKI
ncbi:MAG: CoA-binding protein [Deltaproteobacteria bacterium]|nr:CoA-binding protein [Deltaproteobacteria bacterium]